MTCRLTAPIHTWTNVDCHVASAHDAILFNEFENYNCRIISTSPMGYALMYSVCMLIILMYHPGTIPGSQNKAYLNKLRPRPNELTDLIFLHRNCSVLIQTLLILFPGVKLTICQHWFRWWLGADQATSHYLYQWRPSLLRRTCFMALGFDNMIRQRGCGATWQIQGRWGD